MRQRWHEALTLADDVLLLPASGMAAIRMEQCRSPWSMERRAMHRECMEAKREAELLLGRMEREAKIGSNILVEERRTGDVYLKRFEVTTSQMDNLLNETNETD